MEYFKNYTSNTLAGSGNQSFYYSDDENRIQKSRTFYKVFCGGEYSYSFLFSNIIDSTFSNGSFSHKNIVIDSWEITEARVGITNYCDENSFEEPIDLILLKFNGNGKKTVAPGEFFSSDAVKLNADEEQYICIEMSFKGKMLPYHPESIIPSFVFDSGEWKASKMHPFASMVGIEREVKKKIGFLGDSITQGIGTPFNSYSHWNAVVADMLGRDYSFWNLGLGYGRADDGASNGAWLYKSKQNDIVVVCFGVNDICQGYTSDAIKKNIQKIADKLTDSGVKVILQTVPPFDYSETNRIKWQEVNDFILNECKNVYMCFDAASLLGLSDEEPYRAKYDGHPNSIGCRVWGEELAKAILSSDILSV